MLIDINSSINSSSINRSQRRRQCTTTPNCLHKLSSALQAEADHVYELVSDYHLNTVGESSHAFVVQGQASY